jgi:hypothetical protein
MGIGESIHQKFHKRSQNPSNFDCTQNNAVDEMFWQFGIWSKVHFPSFVSMLTFTSHLKTFSINLNLTLFEKEKNKTIKIGPLENLIFWK